ncbi:unnamed protein product [Vicia faba]|uniref:Homeobox domain-containing protein n=1 Tax=Vicia faba TaxID=3906 RepID=A0AAV1BA81_VICFA|nr:unnamed protein product [Vicia faba]
MSSSNKHWPSMFKKSKPDNHQNWQHGMNSSLLSAGLQTTPVTLGGDVDDRSPEPKSRWNPKPEQIRILESIFNSGMVNPPREEIKKIRAQLQEFGQVGDANVFYWFQNRKSRSKNKHRHLHSNPRNKKNSAAAAQIITAPPNSSSPSSSDHPNAKAPTNEAIMVNNIGLSNVNDGMRVLPNSPNVNHNQTAYNFLQPPAETNFQLPTPQPQPYFAFPMENNNNINEGLAQELYLSDQYSNSNMVQPLPQQNVALPLFNHDIMMNYGTGIGNGGGTSSMNDHQHDQKNIIQEQAMNMMQINQQNQQQLGFRLTSRTHDSSLVPLPPVATPFPIPQFQGVDEEVDKPKYRVIINSTVIEVEVGPFNVRANFGDGAVLFDSSGQQVPTDEWGVTLDSLQHGASYYMV